MTKIKDTPKVLRPREKFLQKGPDALSKSDLLAIVLGSGIKGKNVQELAQQIVRKFSDKFLDVTVDDLQTVDGIGPAKALQITSAIALVKRYYEEKNGKENIIKNSKDVLNLNYEMNIEERKNENTLGKLTYIDLFCGAGGFSLGFDNADFTNIFSVDIEKNFCKTYKENFKNHNLIEKDISKITDDEIIKLVGNKKVDVIIGGPPCQGFSIAGNIGRKFIDDPRNLLFKEFVRVVKVVKPNHFVIENVARLFTHNNGNTKNEIINDFKDIGYEVEAKVLNSADFGVPQIRKRVIFIGTKTSNKINFPNKNVKKYKTVKEALEGLPTLKSGGKSSIPNHIAMTHSDQMLSKMSYVSDGGNRDEIPKNIRPKSGDVRKYIKYNSESPSVTVTGDMRKVFHYSQNRALTVRELARLQSFPDDFIFHSTSISQQQQVGNAVPPLMAEAIANTIKTMSKEKKDLIVHKNKFPKINFIGNKEKLTNWICDYFPQNTVSVLDAFSGGCSVSYEAKRRGYKVMSNDILKINYLLSKSLIENSKEKLTQEDIDVIFSGKPSKGFMYKNYSNILFFPEECMDLDLYRENIKKLNSEYKQSLALILIRRSMIRKMPYSRFNIDWDKIKQLRDEEWSYKKYKRKRAYHNKSFKHHFLENLKEYNKAIFDNEQTNKAYNRDIFSLLKSLHADVIYLDPPYTGTMNNYFGFYGMIDEYIESKKLKPFKNNFIDKSSSLELFNKLFSSLSNYKYWILSYNNSSYPSKDELLYIIGKYSKNIEVIEKPHIYKVTGKENKKINKEYLFIIKNDNFISKN